MTKIRPPKDFVDVQDHAGADEIVIQDAKPAAPWHFDVTETNPETPMTETPEEKIARLEKRLERLKSNMLSSVTRPRIITGAVAMEEARRNREFAATLLAAMDRGQERMVDRQTITPFIEELTETWGLQDRPSVQIPA